MFRYRLRTLLILLGVAPPILAVLWWLVAANPGPAIAISIGYVPFLVLWVVCGLLDKRTRPVRLD